jgi:hypothetical protein
MPVLLCSLACLACFFATLAEGGKTKAWRQGVLLLI